jgi:hypothetical protein
MRVEVRPNWPITNQPKGWLISSAVKQFIAVLETYEAAGEPEGIQRVSCCGPGGFGAAGWQVTPSGADLGSTAETGTRPADRYRDFCA